MSSGGSSRRYANLYVREARRRTRLFSLLDNALFVVVFFSKGEQKTNSAKTQSWRQLIFCTNRMTTPANLSVNTNFTMTNQFASILLLDAL